MQTPVNSKFDRDTPASEVVQEVDLTGKLAVITGGSTGLGKETARALGNAGADVFIGARNEEKLENARLELLGAGTKAVYSVPLDLMEPDSVEQFANAVLDLDRPVDILINNAGIMACPLSRNSLGFEAQLATNFIGHALLTSLLAPALVRAKTARLVSLSSTGHHNSPIVFEDINYESREYEPFVAYGQSKTANVLLAVQAARHLADKGVTVTAVHPGMIETELGRHFSEEEWAGLMQQTKDLDMPDFKTVESGAATSVWAATAPELEGLGPIYLEDCQVAPIVEEPNAAFGVLQYALDPDLADQLWVKAEEMLGRKLPL
ncbi:MAG: SDR family NAD(P)-dependent oxidoreductase [Chloroflexota bacterium]|nr:SDR family NAD(P)-dependent oxidoreductase [Chloroflexota bacterium]